jgi:hypothetical protein
MKKVPENPYKQKSPAEMISARLFSSGGEKWLLLLGGGFASTHFEALFAKHTAFLFGSFS